MPLIYSLVSRSIHVLAEFTCGGLTGNFSTVSRVLLKKIPASEDNKCSYIYDKFVFHYVVSDGLTYLCMADTDFSRAAAFQFLHDIKDRFTATYGKRAQTAIAFAFNADFARVLQAQMDKANAADESSNDSTALLGISSSSSSVNSGQDQRLNQIRNQLGEVKDAMLQNIDKVLLRGEKIELLVDKSEVLEQNAFKFHRGAKNLKRAMWIKNAKWTAIGVVVLTLLIYVILAAACGPKVQCSK